ncbi:hypothetical protein VTK73DRAFT_3595 [Phialemonium thermophilum]|uniref:Uncharacterized protein n=1 Tax=Phialemonium thermophilum TaxID=223376 RepID=A0ABR3VGT4_9PEZI
MKPKEVAKVPVATRLLQRPPSNSGPAARPPPSSRKDCTEPIQEMASGVDVRSRWVSYQANHPLSNDSSSSLGARAMSSVDSSGGLSGSSLTPMAFSSSILYDGRLHRK